MEPKIQTETQIQPSIYVQYEPHVCQFSKEAERIIESRKKSSQTTHRLNQLDFYALGVSPAPELQESLRKICSSEKNHGYLPSFGGMLQRQMASEFCSSPEYTVPTENSYLVYSSYKGFNTILMAMCDRGDSILVPRPTADNLDNFTNMMGFKVLYYKINLDGSIDMESLRKLVEGKEKSPKVMLVHQHHPVLGKKIKNHKEVIDFCAKMRILASFDCSFGLTSQNEAEWKAIVRDASENFPLSIIYDLSKEHGNNGIIVGVLAIVDKADITAPLKRCVENVLQCTLFPCSVSTFLLEDILRKDCTKEWRAKIKENLQKNAKLVYEELSAIDGLEPLLPDDGYVFYCRIDKKLGTSHEIALKLLEKEGFCLNPTSRFKDEENALSFYLAGDAEVYKELVGAIRKTVVH